MKLRTYRDIWRSLNASEKKDLCARSGTGYDYMRVLVSRGLCGRYVAKSIAEALHDMGLVKGERSTAYEQVFPEMAGEAPRMPAEKNRPPVSEPGTKSTLDQNSDEEVIRG